MSAGEAKYQACIDAWKAHPCYDGNDQYPTVRAVCETRNPDTLSYSIERIDGAFGQLRRMAKKRITAEEIKYRIDPIEPDDPYHEFMVCDIWSFPSKARTKYEAKALFRELFPELRPALRHACKLLSMPALRHPDTRQREAKKTTYQKWFSTQIFARLAADMLITSADIWEIAQGKTPIDEVSRLGIRRFPLLAGIDHHERHTRRGRRKNTNK